MDFCAISNDLLQGSSKATWKQLNQAYYSCLSKKICWIVWKPFVLSQSKHERLPHLHPFGENSKIPLPFDGLRANGIWECSTDFSRFMDEDGIYHFWMDTNSPKKVENPGFYLQKLIYIHENPIRKGYVTHPEHWVWSSANPASPLTIRIYMDGIELGRICAAS